MKYLLAPIQISDLYLKNRVFMAPLTRCRSGPGRTPTPLMVEYYRQRATAGLIFTEATSVCPMGVGYPDTPGIWSEQQVEGWSHVTDAVHADGGRIFLQLWHVGRISDPFYLDGELPVAPSAIAAEGHVHQLRPKRPFVTPRALELEEIAELVETYRTGALNAKEAGFDGVEIHGANGYLPNQFLSPASNFRRDRYGGSIENRARFMLELLDAAIDIWGPERVGLHISPADYEYSVAHRENPKTYEYLARHAGMRKIAFICAREALDSENRIGPRLKDIFGGLYVINQAVSPPAGELAIRRGEADAVAFGRLFIANPDLPKRLEIGAELNEPNPDTFYPTPPEPLETGYTDYSALDCEADA